MNTRMRWLWLLLLALAGGGGAQTVHVILPTTYDLIYVGDLDPRGDMTGMGNEIAVQIFGVPAGNWTLDVRLSLGDTWLARGSLNPFTLTTPSQLGPWTLNQIRNNDVHPFTGSGEFNDGFLDRISGNSLPAGLYSVIVELRPHPAGTPVITGQGSFVINDPRRIDLQLPWDGSQVGTDQVTFSWSGRARNYRLRVCEFNPELHGSPQEAIEGDPMWVWDPPADNDPTSAVYGQGDGSARPLVDGRNYVWMVEAVLRTTSGERRFASSIRRFRYNLGQGGGGHQDLAALLGGLTPSQLLGLGDLLNGFYLDGTIVIDGRAVSLEEFQELIRQLAAGELNIATMRIE